MAIPSPKTPKEVNSAKGLITKPIYALLNTFGIGKQPAFQVLGKKQKELADLLYHARYPKSQERKGINALHKIKPLLDYALLAAGTVLAFSGAGLVTFTPTFIANVTIVALSLISVVLIEIFMEVFYSLVEYNRIKKMIRSKILSLDSNNQEETVLDMLVSKPSVSEDDFNSLKAIAKESNLKQAKDFIKAANNITKPILSQADKDQKLLAAIAIQATTTPNHQVRKNQLPSFLSPYVLHPDTATAVQVWTEYTKLRRQAIHIQQTLEKLIELIKVTPQTDENKDENKTVIIQVLNNMGTELPSITEKTIRFRAIYEGMLEINNTLKPPEAQPNPGPAPSSTSILNAAETPSEAKTPNTPQPSTSDAQSHPSIFARLLSIFAHSHDSRSITQDSKKSKP